MIRLIRMVALLAFVGVASTATLADQQASPAEKVFVPFEPYDPAKRDEYRLHMLENGDCGERMVNAMLDQAEQTGYLFSPQSFANAFATILDSDTLNIGCRQSPLRLEFLSVTSVNTLTLKAVVCDPLPNGMNCSRPVVSERYFVLEPGKNFTVSEGVTYDEALEIIEWFRHDAGDQLSSDVKRKARELSWRASIVEDDGAYHYRIGDPHCECVLELVLETGDAPLTRANIGVAETPRISCPN